MSQPAAAVPSSEEILADLRGLMVSEFGLATEQIQPGTHLIDDLDLDSIDLVDLAVAVEEKTGLELDEEQLKSVTTVEDAVAMVRSAFLRRSGDAA